MTIRVTRRAVVVLALALAGIVAAGWYLMTSGPSDTRPVTLPPSFLGLNTSTLNDESTATALADAVAGAPLAVTTYGEPDEGMDTAGRPLAEKLLCWRTSENLNVSAFVLTRPPAEEDVAAAIDALWGSLG